MRYARLDDLNSGDKLIADGGFTCLTEGQVYEVTRDVNGLYVKCVDGRHYLDGQTDNNGECVGLRGEDVNH